MSTSTYRGALVAIVGILVIGVGPVYALTTTWTYDVTGGSISMAHSAAYRWGLQFGGALENLDITGATLQFVGITNNEGFNTDSLFVDLLGRPRGYNDALGWRNAGADTNNGSHDFFTTNPTYWAGVTPLAVFHHPNDLVPMDWSYTLTAAQLARLETEITKDRIIGIGVDPDCHYYAKKLVFTVDYAYASPTLPTPEPSTIALLGLTGVAGFVVKRRKRAA